MLLQRKTEPMQHIKRLILTDKTHDLTDPELHAQSLKHHTEAQCPPPKTTTGQRSTSHAFLFLPLFWAGTPLGDSPPSGAPRRSEPSHPSAAGPPRGRGRAPRAAASPAARSRAGAAGRSGAPSGRAGRCSGPPRRSAAPAPPAGCTGRAGTPAARGPTSN